MTEHLVQYSFFFFFFLNIYLPVPVLVAAWELFPGESGLVSRGSQGLRFPLESRHGSLGAPERLKGVQPPLPFGERTRDCSPGHAGREGPQLARTGQEGPGTPQRPGRSTHFQAGAQGFSPEPQRLWPAPSIADTFRLSLEVTSSKWSFLTSWPQLLGQKPPLGPTAP